MLIPDNSNYAIVFDTDEAYRISMNIIDDNDNVCCSIRIPIETYDIILSHISERVSYGNLVNFSVVTIEIPPCSMRYKYVMILLDTEQFLVVDKIDLITKENVQEFYVNYECIG